MTAWTPEPRLRLINSIRRFKVRRTAQGYALYDHALGKRVSYHKSLGGALFHRNKKRETLKRMIHDLAVNKEEDSGVGSI